MAEFKINKAYSYYRCMSIAEKCLKRPCMQVMKMYKIPSKQIMLVMEDVSNECWQIKSSGIEEILPIEKRKRFGFSG